MDPKIYDEYLKEQVTKPVNNIRLNEQENLGASTENTESSQFNFEELRKKIHQAKETLEVEEAWNELIRTYVNCPEEELQVMKDTVRFIVSGIEFPFNGYNSEEEMFATLVNQLDNIRKSFKNTGRKMQTSDFDDSNPLLRNKKSSGLK